MIDKTLGPQARSISKSVLEAFPPNQFLPFTDMSSPPPMNLSIFHDPTLPS